MPDHIVRPDYAEDGGYGNCYGVARLSLPLSPSPSEGIPHSEKEAKRAAVIQQLSSEEIEKLKVACRVRDGSYTLVSLC